MNKEKETMDHTFVSKTHFNHPEPAEFTEYMHASIAVLFGKQLLKAEKGKEIFSYCVEQYGRERGMRMAKRCLRDQRNLDWQAYADYREWNPSETVIKNNAGSRIQIEQAEPDRISRFLNCPWADQFAKMDAKEIGALYCSLIDPSIVSGFNPSLVFITDKNLGKDGYCLQIQKQCKELKPSALRKENQKGMDYHCAHLFYTFARTIEEVLPDGKEINRKVLDAFAQVWGRETADTLITYKNTDFLKS